MEPITTTEFFPLSDVPSAHIAEELNSCGQIKKTIPGEESLSGAVKVTAD